MMVPSQWPCPIDDIVIWSYAFDDGDDVVERAHEVLADGGLAEGVTADWEQLSGGADAPPLGSPRWAEWAMGRGAVRQAATAVGLTDVRVERSLTGAPVIADSAWGVSIAHTSGLVLGAVGPGRIGVDVERADRDVTRLVRALLPDERELTVSLSAISIIVAKEAAAKATGQGLEGSLARWPVVDVELSGSAPRIGVASAAARVIDVRIYEHCGYVTGLASYHDD
ncbi:MAG: hypothetical protein CL523_03645 [Actinomycetales bacterium]|jgi:hypothetical protein|nr:MAG: hypothetical protein CL523_03645 [Actinomycetales bacterium]